MLTSPLADTDFVTVLASVDALDADATMLRDCDDFAAFCDERRDAWVEAHEADAATDH